MESCLYSLLEALRIDFSKELKDHEYIEANEILSSWDENSLLTISGLSNSLKFFISTELLLKTLSSDLNPTTIEIIFESLNNLKSKISDDLIYKELKAIKRHLKNKLFEFNLVPENLASTFKTINAGVKLSEMFEIVFGDDLIKKLAQIYNNLKFIKGKLINHESCAEEYIKLKIIKAYDECCSLKSSYTKRLNETLAHLIDNSTVDIQVKAGINLLNKKRAEERLDLSRIDNLCEELDKTIKKLKVNPDYFESLPSNPSQSYASSELYKVIRKSRIDLEAIKEKFQELNINRNPYQPTFFDFETIFIYTLYLILSSSGNCLNELSKFSEFKMNGLNLLKAFCFLKTLPISISQTICEIMIGASDPRYQSSFYKFFLKDMYKNLKYMKISDEVYNTFISLALKTPIREILERFKNSEFSLEEVLQRVTPNIYFMSFPEKLTGITLKTQQITLKLFESENFKEDHKLGGYFVVYLHELAHYLQRTGLDYVRETNQKTSPKLDQSEPDEGGKFLEMLVFGNEMTHIYYSQARFLLEGIFPNEIGKFRQKFESEIKSDNQPPLPLYRSNDILFLGNCGSFYGLLPPRF